MFTNPFKEIAARRFGFYFLQGYHSHRFFCKWVKDHSEDISSVLEIGCGFFEFYSYFFKSMDIDYTGLDLLPKAVDSRKDINPEQNFICANFMNHPIPEKYDLVFSHMFLSGMLGEATNLRMLELKVKASNRYGFAVIWDIEDVNIQNYVLHLSHLGCRNINVLHELTKLPVNQPQYEIILYWEQ